MSVVEGHLRDATKIHRELVEAADQAEKKALSDWKKGVNPFFKTIDSNLQLVADKTDVQYSNFELARTKGSKALEAIRADAVAIRELAEGVADLEAQFVQVCLGLEARTQKVLDLVRSSFAEAGGAFDRARFNAMNFREPKHKMYQDPAAMEEARVTLKRGIAALNLGKKELEQGVASFRKTMESLPGFAKKTNPAFAEVLEALEKAKEIYGKYEEEAKGLASAANSAAEHYKRNL